MSGLLGGSSVHLIYKVSTLHMGVPDKTLQTHTLIIHTRPISKDSIADHSVTQERDTTSHPLPLPPPSHPNILGT
ncbi:hypothetical protein E2C01_028515 [Portunus trituberculatus]|uniref:Uncharacterized protein n=1 Tax=Portunus trituberculatus TaxID=210409 RepID=A0A5B7EKU9_PORTR|nr:hypothetical protein [Portunus trituberculatus]